jgi:ABC-type transporter Mla maintaining outer membrane lipid asymmetry permease subunit MlaE
MLKAEPQSVGQAANSAVVTASLSILFWIY